MDQHGRLHMPGFVGQTFEETGVLSDTSPRGGNEMPERRGNRKERRREAAMDRQQPKEHAQ